MGKYDPWLKPGRQAQLDMGLNWRIKLTEEVEDETGAKVKLHVLVGMPEATLMKLATLTSEAQNVLAEAKDAETRTKVINKKVAVTFKALVTLMRYIKKKYFLMPPLTEALYVALGLKVPDETHTFTEEPTAQIVAELSLTKGKNQLCVKTRYLEGSPKDRANKTYEHWYVLRAPGEKAPESPEEFTKLFDTQRMNDLIKFGFGSSAKIVYVISRVANGKKKGAWGPIVSAVVP